MTLYGFVISAGAKVFNSVGSQEKEKPKQSCFGFRKGPRRRPTLPHKKSCSTISAEELNDRVRDGIGCDLFAKTTGNYAAPPQMRRHGAEYGTILWFRAAT